MQSHDELVTRLMVRPSVCAELDRLEREESAMLDALLKVKRNPNCYQTIISPL